MLNFNLERKSYGFQLFRLSIDLVYTAWSIVNVERGTKRGIVLGVS